MNSFEKHTGLVLFCLALISCSFWDIPPPKNPLENEKQLKDAMEVRRTNVSAARFKEVILDYFGKDERVKLRQLILVKRTDSLRVQTRVPGSEEIMSLLVSRGPEFALHNRKNNKYYTGEPTPTNISRLLPVNLSSSDVVNVMLGGAPWMKIGAIDGKTSFKWNRNKGLYELTKKASTGERFVLFVRPHDYGLAELKHIGADGGLIYHYTTDEWRDFGDVTIPLYRRFQWPERDLDFSLYAGEAEINPSLPASLFEFPPPPGSRVIEVGEDEQ